ncbi:hemerythrin domain-containing protein [Bordetella petrii]|nr:hemerythrin domain-containing protein [Bordetella petrii]
MNIDKFKQQHLDILQGIAALRRLSQAGVARNAGAIARGIINMSSTIKLHLAIEDRMLYPVLARSRDAELAETGRCFQQEMGSIAQAYAAFAQRWSNVQELLANETGFKADANIVLRKVRERMLREDSDLYPRVEAL